LGIYLGIAAAKREGGAVDASIRISAVTIWCIPIFWLGIMLQVFIVLYAPIIPLSGRLSARIILDKITGLYILDSILTRNMVAFVDSLKHLILPVFTLGITMAASLTRLARANIIEVLGEEYIRVARLKGCSEKIVFQKHALPNALIPILTYAGLQTAMLMGGAILTETTFSWPGLGRLILFAVSYRDFTLIQGCVVFWALIISLFNFIIDIFYAIIDPRVRY
jgi:peptide/nickel transport system permease protein